MKPIDLNNRGASMVEFALVLPVLLLILFGIIEFGIIIYNQQVITNASREGARFGIVSVDPRKSDAEIQDVVTNYTGNHLISFGVNNTPNIIITRSGISFGDNLTVKVNYHFTFLVLPNFVSSLLNGFEQNAETVMKYE